MKATIFTVPVLTFYSCPRGLKHNESRSDSRTHGDERRGFGGIYGRSTAAISLSVSDSFTYLARPVTQKVTTRDKSQQDTDEIC